MLPVPNPPMHRSRSGHFHYRFEPVNLTSEATAHFRDRICGLKQMISAASATRDAKLAWRGNFAALVEELAGAVGVGGAARVSGVPIGDTSLLQVLDMPSDQFMNQFETRVRLGSYREFVERFANERSRYDADTFGVIRDVFTLPLQAERQWDVEKESTRKRKGPDKWEQTRPAFLQGLEDVKTMFSAPPEKRAARAR